MRHYPVACIISTLQVLLLHNSVLPIEVAPARLNKLLQRCVTLLACFLHPAHQFKLSDTFAVQRVLQASNRRQCNVQLEGAAAQQLRIVHSSNHAWCLSTPLHLTNGSSYRAACSHYSSPCSTGQAAINKSCTAKCDLPGCPCCAVQVQASKANLPALPAALLLLLTQPSQHTSQSHSRTPVDANSSTMQQHARISCHTTWCCSLAHTSCYSQSVYLHLLLQLLCSVLQENLLAGWGLR